MGRKFTFSSQQQQSEKDSIKEGKEGEEKEEEKEGEEKNKAGEKDGIDCSKREIDGAEKKAQENEVKDEERPIRRNPPDLGRFLNTFTLFMGLWILFTILSQRTSVIETNWVDFFIFRVWFYLFRTIVVCISS